MSTEKGIPGEIEIISENEFRGTENCKAVVVKEFKGKTYCHIRNFFKTQDNKEWGFGKGISLDGYELNFLLNSKALEKALEKMLKLDKSIKKGNYKAEGDTDNG